MTIKSIVTKSFVCSVALATTLFAGSASAEQYNYGPNSKPPADLVLFANKNDCLALLATGPSGIISSINCMFIWCAEHPDSGPQCQIHSHAGGSVHSHNKI